MRLILLGVAISLSTPAMAWTHSNADDSCAFAQIFGDEGKTTLTVIQRRKDFEGGFLVIVVSNEKWTINSGDNISDKMSIKTRNSEITGNAISIDKGFVLLARTQTMNDFSSSTISSVAEIYKGKQLIEVLDMEGFFTAHSRLERCTYPWRDERAELQRKEWREKNIPADPFAKPRSDPPLD